MNRTLKHTLRNAATIPYRDTGIINYQWARGKLGGDPIFAALIDHSVFPDGARILDLGCGRGLLPAWLLTAERLAEEGRWPAGSPRPPRNLTFRGLELMGKEAECGNQALQPVYPGRVALAGGDMREADLSGLDAIAILDALHYIDYAEQDRLLDRIRAALPEGGVFLTRIGDAGGGLRFHLSEFADRCISFIQGHRLPRMWCRPFHDWLAALEARGFTVETMPMNGATPFANIMLIARVPGHLG